MEMHDDMSGPSIVPSVPAPLKVVIDFLILIIMENQLNILSMLPKIFIKGSLYL